MTTPNIVFAPAVRHAVKGKFAVDGPSGAGKTEGALELATAIIKHYGGKIALADTEALGEKGGAASLYADRYTFDTILIPQALPATIEKVIEAAVAQGYTVLVIDTLSHIWQDVLARKEQHELNDPKANRFALWGKYGPEWDSVVAKIVKANIHVIVTMRSKQSYEQSGEGKGSKIVKLGLQPQVREGSEYEFSIVFSVNMAHRATVTKGRAVPWEVDSELLDLRSSTVHAQLIGWMDAGGTLQQPPPRAVAAPAKADPYAGYDPATIDIRSAQNLPLYGAESFAGGFGGRALSDVPTEHLEVALAKYEQIQAKGGLTPRQAHVITLMLAAIKLVVADREAQADADLFADTAPGPVTASPSAVADAVADKQRAAGAQRAADGEEITDDLAF